MYIRVQIAVNTGIKFLKKSHYNVIYYDRDVMDNVFTSLGIEPEY